MKNEIEKINQIEVLKNELSFSELEDRLEMVQAVAVDRCKQENDGCNQSCKGTASQE